MEGWVVGYVSGTYVEDTVVGISKDADDVIVVEGAEAYYVLTNVRMIE